MLRAKHPLARIGTARKSLAPAATRLGSASRSPLLNVSTEGFHPDLGACAHGLTGVRFDRLAADRPFLLRQAPPARHEPAGHRSTGRRDRGGVRPAARRRARPDAARSSGIIRRLAAAGPVTPGDKGYYGAGDLIMTAYKARTSPPRRKTPTAHTRSYAAQGNAPTPSSRPGGWNVAVRRSVTRRCYRAGWGRYQGIRPSCRPARRHRSGWPRRACPGCGSRAF